MSDLSVSPHPSPTNVKKNSVVEYFGHGANFCGYCKSKDPEGRRSYDMKAYSLKAKHYQKLLDQGWRRSGDYCYNPINSKTCCPNYPISCKALDFNLTRSQRRCIANVNSFLIHGDTNNKQTSIDYDKSSTFANDSSPPDSKAGRKIKMFEEYKASSKLRDIRFVKSCERKVKLYNISLEEAVERTQERNRRRHFVSKSSLEDYLYPQTSALSTNTSDITPKHNLVIKLLHVDSNKAKALIQDEYEVISKYQQAIHNEGPEEWSLSRFSDFLIKTPLIVEQIKNYKFSTTDSSNDTLVSNSYTDESKYILVKPPELPTCYGTYHCVYLLDDKLIAVGVLDILTKCVTTVYFFYDPEYKHLNLGIYSALVEISLVRQMAKSYVGLEKENKLVHYYLGFYVHECKKMHYKTRFRPSYLLCSETCKYIPTQECLKKLIGTKYARFGPNPSEGCQNSRRELPSIGDIFKIPVKAPCIQTNKMFDYFTWLEDNIGSFYVDILVNNILVNYLRFVTSPLAFKMTLQVNAVHNALVHGRQMHTESRNSTTTDPASNASSTNENQDCT